MSPVAAWIALRDTKAGASMTFAASAVAVGIVVDGCNLTLSLE